MDLLLEVVLAQSRALSATPQPDRLLPPGPTSSLSNPFVTPGGPPLTLNSGLLSKLATPIQGLEAVECYRQEMLSNHPVVYAHFRHALATALDLEFADLTPSFLKGFFTERFDHNGDLALRLRTAMAAEQWFALESLPVPRDPSTGRLCTLIILQAVWLEQLGLSRGPKKSGLRDPWLVTGLKPPPPLRPPVSTPTDHFGQLLHRVWLQAFLTYQKDLDTHDQATASATQARPRLPPDRPADSSTPPTDAQAKAKAKAKSEARKKKRQSGGATAGPVVGRE